MSKIHKLFLEDLDASNNIRRACIGLYYKDVNPWSAVVDLALSDSLDDNCAFFDLIFEEIDIVKLAISLHQTGQINPILVKEENGKYVVLAGQRRCVAAGFLEALRRIFKFGDSEEINKIKKQFYDIGVDLDYKEFQKNDDGTTVDCQILVVDKDQALQLAFDENDLALQMNDLDWGIQLKRLLETNNPKTDKNYTLQDLSSKFKKPYQFIRGRSALPYLPKDWQQKLDEGVINITDAINYALKLKDDAVIAEAEQFIQPSSKPEKLVEAKDAIESVHKVVEVSPEDIEATKPPEEKSWTDAVPKKRSKKIKCMTGEQIMELLKNTNSSNLERIGALAEVLYMDVADALNLAQSS